VLLTVDISVVCFAFRTSSMVILATFVDISVVCFVFRTSSMVILITFKTIMIVIHYV